jgi:integrase
MHQTQPSLIFHPRERPPQLPTPTTASTGPFPPTFLPGLPSAPPAVPPLDRPQPPFVARFRASPLLSVAHRRARSQRNLGPPPRSTSSARGLSYDPRGPLADIFSTIGDIIDLGVPEGTLEKDDLAWRRWETFCTLAATSPWRLDRNAHSGADTAGCERESKLLCAFLIWSYDLITPRSRTSSAPKPSSAYAMVAGVRRVHKRHHIDMVSSGQLSAVLRGITAAHIREHGSESLLPHRKEPLGPPLLRTLLSTPSGTNLGSTVLDWSSPLFLCLGAMFTLGGGTGFRKSEVSLPDGSTFDDRRLRRSSLLWRINGTLHTDPSDALLASMVPLRDMAVIKPPRSKADRDGTKFGSHPIYQLYDPSDPANAATWLRRLEILFPCHGPGRLHRALFFSNSRDFSPITHSTVDRLLHLLLCCHMTDSAASKFSFHSFRIGFACALLAAGCSYDMIQALARWSSSESVTIYARLNPSDYTSWVAKALLQQTTSTTTANFPIIDAHAAIAAFASN